MADSAAAFVEEADAEEMAPRRSPMRRSSDSLRSFRMPSRQLSTAPSTDPNAACSSADRSFTSALASPLAPAPATSAARPIALSVASRSIRTAS